MRRLVLVLGLAISLQVVPSALAAVAPKFNRSMARTGQSITVFQPGGLPWLSRDKRRMRIYLVRAEVVSKVIGADGVQKKGPPPSALARYVGTWTESARLTFRLPPLRVGRYAAVAWCRACGGTLIASVPWSVPSNV